MVKQSVLRRRPRTARGRSTRARLLKGAEWAFYTHGYPQTSVAEICRRARVANGTFYQYFSDKTGIFTELVQSLADFLRRRLIHAASAAHDPFRRLLAMHRAFFSAVSAKTPAYQVFRETEFVDFDLSQAFYRPVARLYEEAIRDGTACGALRSRHPEATAWALLGLQEFVATRWLIWEAQALESNRRSGKLRDRECRSKVVQATEDFLARGLGGRFEPRLASLPLSTEASPPTTQTRRGSPPGTRKALLAAAEQLFGANGFYATSVSEITRRVGVAQGTFYLYFPSKVAIFAQLVREINRALIEEIRRATSGLSDRCAIEQAGFRAFFRFIRRHRLAYRIVREAEFVDEEAGQGYYRRIAAGYVKGLTQAMAQGQIRRIDPEPVAYCLMGLGHFAGLRWLVWEDLNEIPEDVFAELMRFAFEGVAGR